MSNAPITLTQDHPVFARLHTQAMQYAQLCADIMYRSFPPPTPDMVRKAYENGYKHIAKQYGLTGKYVGHDGAKQRGV